MQLIKLHNHFSKNQTKSKFNIFFSNIEIKLILQLYSKQVANGVCKDYAIDYSNKMAIFAFYKHSFDKPIFQIEKITKKKNNFIPIFYIKYNKQILYKSTSLTTLIKKLENKFRFIKLKKIS